MMNYKVIGWGSQNRFDVVGAALSGWRTAPKFCSDTTSQPCSCMQLSSSLTLIEYNLDRVVSMKSDATPQKRGAEWQTICLRTSLFRNSSPPPDPRAQLTMWAILFLIPLYRSLTPNCSLIMSSFTTPVVRPCYVEDWYPKAQTWG
jgi:hypothetical protein